ncbi:hypothetical protein [Steroidobacter agaridevorans]|uniref:hypothetical protein n=1 Tax=Steroidobacter agaridevorans TaxID=2695856 RepID=UPI001326C2D6|nr:hypothetical protein [Steroidobacter agaridevorans]GFE87801.1 hypothetical protein GCM10011488_27550 [Steroidobacter agaridevorans]
MNDSMESTDANSTDTDAMASAPVSQRLAELASQLREAGIVQLVAVYERENCVTTFTVTCVDAQQRIGLSPCPILVLAEVISIYGILVRQYAEEGDKRARGQFDWYVLDNKLTHEHKSA